MPDPVGDEVLVLRCQLGERGAFADLVRAWHQPLWGYLRSTVTSHELAEDLIQDVWIAVLRGLPRLRQPERFAPWLFTLAHRSLVDHLRRAGARPTEIAVDVDVDGPDAAELDGTVDRALLVAEIRTLPPAEREVVVLFHLHDLTLTEVAEVVDAPVGTVKSRLSRARQRLHQQMLDKGYER